MKSRPVQYLITAVLSVLFTFVALEARCADVVKPAAIYLSLSAADLGSTAWAIRNGAHEGNPAMVNHRAVKQLAMASAFTGADVLLQRNGKRREARVLRVVYAAVRVTAVVLNVRTARRGK